MSALAPAAAALSKRRLRLIVDGAVQGVGFRPFVYRLAIQEGLSGFVCNTASGALVEIEGPAFALDRFLVRLDSELAAPASIATLASEWLDPNGGADFSIRDSLDEGAATARVLPDLAVCAECLEDIRDPANRRRLYPFTTCTRCGPRYSIIEAVPYDRARTAMRGFPMCAACQAEYDDPNSRRFHAESIGCPQCGPQLALVDSGGVRLHERHAALLAAAEALRRGRIVALKGLGGFQLLCDARNAAAVERLRRGKQRPSKPLAVMVASLAAARALADLTPVDATTLALGAAPIVLVRAQRDTGIAESVAPRSLLLGLMLPTTPLHQLLLDELGFPLVATSGNRRSEPILTETGDAVGRLAGLADLFLVHNRPILRPVDDSVVRVIAGTPTMLRLARGYAPLSIDLPAAAEGIALGGHQKAALAIARGRQMILGPHIGDLDSVEARQGLDRAIAGFVALHRLAPAWVACDTHPDYHTTRRAEGFGPPVRQVPHHLAHVLSAMLEHGLDGPVLGVAWDGTGDGRDGTTWGGEFLTVTPERWGRIASLTPFRLPGGERAAREPRRAALGVLNELDGTLDFNSGTLPVAAFTDQELPVLQTMLQRGVNAPSTSSAGRLFDAVASILGLCQRASFEGEAAIAVEFAAGRAACPAPLPPLRLAPGQPFRLDWRPTLAGLIEARNDGAGVETLALGFHHALAEAITEVAQRAAIADVVLTGGCFQNALLAELASDRLATAGFRAHRHARIPPNDGGLAAGQIAFAARPRIEEIA